MFNENKYKKCIERLKDLKTLVILSYMLILALVGLGIGLPIMMNLFNKVYIPVITTGIGLFLGLFFGLSSVWRIEMKIQEANWKIDVLEELKKQNLIKNSTPIAKTVVAIENNQVPKKIETSIDE